MKKLIVCSIVIFMCACTPTPVQKPNRQAYEINTKLMIDICNKFAHEPDGAKLHKAAVSTQYAHVVLCADFNDECSLYGSCLTAAIQASKTGTISSEGRADMEAKLTALRKAVDGGLEKLRK